MTVINILQCLSVVSIIFGLYAYVITRQSLFYLGSAIFCFITGISMATQSVSGFEIWLVLGAMWVDQYRRVNNVDNNREG